MNNYTFVVDKDSQKLIRLVNATDNEKAKNEAYGMLINNFVRQYYKQSEVEAILNNYLDDMTKEKNINEFRELQNVRASAKAYAKELLNLD